MARYKFAKTPDEAQKQSAVVPVGEYPARLVSAQTKTSQSGNEMWDCKFVITEGDYEGREVAGRIVFTPNTEKTVYAFFNAFGSHLGDSIHDHLNELDTDGSQDVLVGRIGRIRVVHEPWTDKNGNPRISAKADSFGYRPLVGRGPLNLDDDGMPAAPASGGKPPASGGSAGKSASAPKTGPAAIAEVDYGDVPF